MYFLFGFLTFLDFPSLSQLIKAFRSCQWGASLKTNNAAFFSIKNNKRRLINIVLVSLPLSISLSSFSLGTNNYSQLQILISQTKRVKSFYHLRLGHYSLLIRALKYANETRSQNEAQINFSINIIIIYYLSDSGCCLSSPHLLLLPHPLSFCILLLLFAAQRWNDAVSAERQ